jgi:hypothetical protein
MDAVVTVPKQIWEGWIAEGDPVGDPWTGEEWGFYAGCLGMPQVHPGDRVYVVAHGRMRGYAPLIRLARPSTRSVCFVRGGGAIAVTIPEIIRGFQGFRYRWWSREWEVPFPGWRTAGVPIPVSA